MTEPLTPTVFDFQQILPPLGFHFPTRMTVLPLGGRKLALVSPIPIDDQTAASLAALGDVAYLVAPNLLHHLYLADAIRRYPGATVLAPPALRTKRPDLRIDATLDAPLPGELAAAVEVVRVQGMPALDEFVLFHRESRTLVVTDLVFNLVHPEGLVAHAVLSLVGCHGRLATSRAVRLLVKDRPAAAASLERILLLPSQTLVMAHGEVVRAGAGKALAQAFRW
jgi:hypothetical protein